MNYAKNKHAIVGHILIDMSNSLFRQTDFSPLFVVILLENYKCKNIKLYVFWCIFIQGIQIFTQNFKILLYNTLKLVLNIKFSTFPRLS